MSSRLFLEKTAILHYYLQELRSVAQWWSARLISGWLQVRILPDRQKCAHSSVAERLLDTQKVVGSIPTARTLTEFRNSSTLIIGGSTNEK